MCNCKHISVAVYSCKRCAESDRRVLKFLIQALLDVALFQLVKGDFPTENIAEISENSSGRIMEFLLQKLVIHACFNKV
jgi:hypothetical protein